jgi:cytochrome c oxidase cbb3-type subunit 3
MRRSRVPLPVWSGAVLVALAACACSRTPASQQPAAQPPEARKPAAQQPAAQQPESQPPASFAAVSHEGGRSPLDASLETGAAIYGRYCAICHGETGGGDGFNAYNVSDTFGVSPTAFSDPEQMASLKEADLIAAIRDGGPAVGKSPAMPAWGRTLTTGEIADVGRFLRTLAKSGQDP